MHVFLILTSQEYQGTVLGLDATDISYFKITVITI